MHFYLSFETILIFLLALNFLVPLLLIFNSGHKRMMKLQTIVNLVLTIFSTVLGLDHRIFWYSSSIFSLLFVSPFLVTLFLKINPEPRRKQNSAKRFFRLFSGPNSGAGQSGRKFFVGVFFYPLCLPGLMSINRGGSGCVWACNNILVDPFHFLPLTLSFSLYIDRQIDIRYELKKMVHSFVIIHHSLNRTHWSPLAVFFWAGQSEKSYFQFYHEKKDRENFPENKIILYFLVQFLFFS